MTYLLVPHQATATAITVWLAAVQPAAPPRLDLHVGALPALRLDGGWQPWPSAARAKLWHQRVQVEGLDAGTRYPLRLHEAGAERAFGIGATLPDRLPGLDEQPFICLLGSCFAMLSDQAGAAGAAFAALPAGARPTVKFMSGDQVYLDAPFPKYLYNLYSEHDLEAELLATYVATWTQAGDRSGFAGLLGEGATYFSSDDHELWNNAPSPTPIVRATWWPLGDRGAAWLRIAGSLYDTFQAPYRSAAFDVGRLSFRVLDTRLDRTRDRSRFADAGEFSALAEWVDGLAGPGVLIVGQPIFVDSTGLKGHLTDWGLADFEQYAELVRTLARAQHDIIVLTGDVHFGRVAGCRLPSGANLYEIIASPFALIDSRFGGRWGAPPAVFPAGPVAGVAQRPIWTAEHRLADNHFATLEFAADGPGVRLRMRAWPIPGEGGRVPSGDVCFSQVLN